MRGRAALAVLALAFALGACVPLYVPPVPTDTVRPEPRLTLDPRTALRIEEGRPSLEVWFETVPASGWLAVQWFGPDNRERASDAIWIETGESGRRHLLRLPGEGAPDPGDWRAVLSFGGSLLRQLAATVEAP